MRQSEYAEIEFVEHNPSRVALTATSSQLTTQLRRHISCLSESQLQGDARELGHKLSRIFMIHFDTEPIEGFEELLCCNETFILCIAKPTPQTAHLHPALIVVQRVVAADWLLR